MGEGIWNRILRNPSERFGAVKNALYLLGTRLADYDSPLFISHLILQDLLPYVGWTLYRPCRWSRSGAVSHPRQASSISSPGQTRLRVTCCIRSQSVVSGA